MVQWLYLRGSRKETLSRTSGDWILVTSVNFSDVTFWIWSHVSLLSVVINSNQRFCELLIWLINVTTLLLNTCANTYKMHEKQLPTLTADTN